jgi:hypothetical protein
MGDMARARGKYQPTMPLLVDFMQLGIRHFFFIQDFVGAFDPPRRPHTYRWLDAEDHWELTINAILSTDLITADLKTSDKVKRAAVISGQLLWILARLELCPLCPDTKAVVAGMADELGTIEYGEEL